MTERRKVQLYDSTVVFPKKTYTGLQESFLSITEGARIVFTMYVYSLDPGSSVTAKVKTTFSEAMPSCEVLTLTANSVQHVKGVLSDFHSFLDMELEVTSGSAEVILGLNVYDNALTTRIDNAEISVDLNHTVQTNGQYDSTRIGDGTEELAINPDGSLNVNIVNTSVIPEIVKNIFNKITNIDDLLRTSVVSHTTAVGKETYLQIVHVNGNNTADYELEIDGEVIDEITTYFGSRLDGNFEFNAYSENGLLLPEGINVEIFVTHYRPFQGDFSSRIQILEIG